MCAFALPQAWLAAQEPPKPSVTQQTTQPPATPAPVPAPAAAAEDEGNSPSIGIFYWYNPGHFHLRNGKAGIVGDNPANLDYGGRNQPSPGAELTFPAGKYNSLSVKYFRTHGSGATVTPVNIKAFNTDFPAGTAVSTKYTLQNVKASWNYLSWPYPPKDSSFLVKTLWQIQYTNVKSELDAPLLNTDTLSYYSTKSHWFIYPSVGLGLEKKLSRTARWELQASGFAFPHRSTVWDAETFFAVRSGRLEFQFGAKAFYFRTTPKKSEYVYATVAGPYLEIKFHAR